MRARASTLRARSSGDMAREILVPVNTARPIRPGR